MQISLNIIVDSLSKYNYEIYTKMPSDIIVRRFLPLPRDLETPQKDCLYFGLLSEALRLKSRLTDLVCICVRDRISTGEDSETLLSGLIIVNENMDVETLFSEVTDTLDKVIDWYQAMQEAVILNKSLQDIITMSETIIGNFISMSDSALTLVAYTKNIPTDDPVSVFLVENKYHSEEAVRWFKSNRRFDTWMNAEGLIINADRVISNYIILSKVFNYNNTYFQHVVMTCNNHEFSPGLVDLFNYLLKILSHCIRREWESRKDYDNVYSSLIIDLIRGSIKNREVINDRANFVGIKPEDEYIVMLVTGGSQGTTIFPGLLAQELSRHFTKIRTVYHDGRLMLFLHDTDISRYLSDQGQGVEKKLDEFFRSNNIRCGMSDVFKDLMELDEAYCQAELALEESGILQRNPRFCWEGKPQFKNLLTFSMYFSYCMIDQDGYNEKIWRSSKYGKLLLDLYASDLEKETNNLELLYTYLANERRATETAVELHMHRNNILYRIKRIEEALDVSLDDRLTRLNLTMSFLMLKRYQL